MILKLYVDNIKGNAIHVFYKHNVYKHIQAQVY